LEPLHRFVVALFDLFLDRAQVGFGGADYANGQ
jgi:hypothetical protein